MRQVLYSLTLSSLGLAMVTGLPAMGWAYPAFGRLPYVSDAAPYCATCHASTDEAYHKEIQADSPFSGKSQVHTVKHYKALEEGLGAYKTTEPDQRKKLLEQAKQVDQNSSIKLDAPTSVAPSGTITVTVTAKGGMGPVNGIMLVDEASRYQARPVQSAGWFIATPPEVVGPDGKPQGTWLDRRANKQQTNLNYVLVYGITPQSSESQVSYVLKAPQTPGDYSIAAAFLYGTGEANEMKDGKYVEPPGGGTSPSGRVQFSNVVRVKVE